MRHTVEMVWLAWQQQADPFDALVLTSAALAWLLIVLWSIGHAAVRGWRWCSVAIAAWRGLRHVTTGDSGDWLGEGNARPRRW